MFLSVLIVTILALAAIYISFFILPGNFSGLGLDVFGHLLAVIISFFIFARMILLGKHFGFKDDGTSKESTFIGKIWVPFSILIAMVCGLVTSKLLA